MTFNVTAKLPLVVYACSGFCWVDCVPSPKSQNHVVLVVPVLATDRSVNWERTGKQPELSLTEKRGNGLPYKVIRFVLEMVFTVPCAFLMVSFTV